MPLDRDRVRLLIDVAERHYLGGQSQVEIAGELSFSPATVSRMLAQARDAGIVQIQITHPLQQAVALEQQLGRRFRTRCLVAVAEPDDHPGAAVSRLAARELTDAVGPDSVLAVSNGTTIAHLADRLRPVPATRVITVQMIGSLGGHTTMVDSSELCRAFSAIFGGVTQLMPIPLILESADLVDALRRDPTIAAAMAMAARADVALLGIGAVDSDPEQSIFRQWMTEPIRDEIAASGAVGHLVGHHFAADGSHVETALCARTSSISLSALRGIRRVIGVAHGVQKAAAIRGALSGGLLNTLVTDAATARAVLQSEPGPGR